MKMLWDINNKIKLLIGGFLLIIILLIFISISSPNKPTPIPPQYQPTPTVIIAIPGQKYTIGETKAGEINQNNSVIKQEPKLNLTKYSLRSSLDLRPNIVMTDGNVVVFESIIVPQESASIIKLSDYLKRYGVANKTFTGSNFYGSMANTYVFTSQGLAIIANSYTNEIYELQVFSPTTIENYVKYYGDDIKTVPARPETP